MTFLNLVCYFVRVPSHASGTGLVPLRGLIVVDLEISKLVSLLPE